MWHHGINRNKLEMKVNSFTNKRFLTVTWSQVLSLSIYNYVWLNTNTGYKGLFVLGRTLNLIFFLCSCQWPLVAQICDDLAGRNVVWKTAQSSSPSHHWVQLPDIHNLKEETSVLVHGFGGLSPWSVGSKTGRAQWKAEEKPIPSWQARGKGGEAEEEDRSFWVTPPPTSQQAHLLMAH